MVQYLLYCWADIQTFRHPPVVLTLHTLSAIPHLSVIGKLVCLQRYTFCKVRLSSVQPNFTRIGSYFFTLQGPRGRSWHGSGLYHLGNKANLIGAQAQQCLKDRLLTTSLSVFRNKRPQNNHSQ